MAYRLGWVLYWVCLLGHLIRSRSSIASTKHLTESAHVRTPQRIHPNLRTCGSRLPCP